MWTDNKKEVQVPKHTHGRYVRQDPSGGGQKLFWLLLLLAAMAGCGLTVIFNPDFFAALFK